MDLIVLRLLFVALLGGVCYFLHPFGLTGWVSAGVGAAAAGAVIVFELRVRALSLRRLIGAVTGSVLGIFGAALFCLVLRSAPLAPATSAVLQIFVLLLMTYVGLLVGASKGDLLNPAALGTVFATDRPTRRNAKVLDTSVIIDGRIADIAEAGFIDGMMVVPEFVLRELQVVADSTDGSKAAARPARAGHAAAHAVQHQHPGADRSRRFSLHPRGGPEAAGAGQEVGGQGGDQRLQPEQGGPPAPRGGAEHQRPGQRAEAGGAAGRKDDVLILKEGKEFNQGVGYLDDGTMVVVDHARKLIGKPVEISVTSVLQTASGKMIFGKMEENGRSGEQGRPGPVEIER